MGDHDMSREFLRLLNSETYVFRTFTDGHSKKRRDLLARTLIGTFNQHRKALDVLSSKGAGIFVMINECEIANDKVSKNVDGAEIITRVRAIFLDVDNKESPVVQSIENIQKYLPPPNMVVNTSPGKFHFYWLVYDCDLVMFKEKMRSLAVIFGCDPGVASLNRVMRLPGYAHQKGEPYSTTLLQTRHEAVIECAALFKNVDAAPILTALKTVQQTGAANSTFIVDTTNPFGFAVREAYQAPDTLPEGDRTQKMVQRAGQLAGQGFFTVEIREILLQENVDKCPIGQTPKTLASMEKEVLKSVPKFVAKERRKAGLPSESELKPSVARLPIIGPQLAVENGKLVEALEPPSIIEPDRNCDEVFTYASALDRFVFIAAGTAPRVGDRDRLGEEALYSLTSFKSKFSNVRIAYPRSSSSAQATTKAQLPTVWLTSPQRYDVYNDTFVPKAEQIVIRNDVKYFNLYRPPTMKPATTFNNDRIKPFLDHLHATFTDQASFHTFCCWVAMTVNFPEIRVPWAPLLISKPGAGKGFIFQVLTKMVGHYNAYEIGADRLDKAFNTFLYRNVLVLIDEMHKDLKLGTHAKLKVYISELRVEIDGKNTPEGLRDIFCNVIIFSNQDNTALIIDEGDRRYWVYKWTTVPAPEMFTMLFKWLKDDENIAHLLAWVRQYDMKDFNYAKRPPMTQAKSDMIESSVSDLTATFRDAIEAREGPFKSDLCYMSLAKEYLESKGQDIKGFKPLWIQTTTAIVPASQPIRLKNTDTNVKVRCLRNLNYWREQPLKNITHEVTRADALFRTPNDDTYTKPMIEEVETTGEAK